MTEEDDYKNTSEIGKEEEDTIENLYVKLEFFSVKDNDGWPFSP